MRTPARAAVAVLFAIVALCSLKRSGCAADSPADTQAQLRELREQNEALQLQMRKQQELIDELSRKVSSLPPTPRAAEDETARDLMRAPIGTAFGKVHLSGEGGIGLFHSGSRGQFPNSEFRVDEAKLFVEAPIFGEVYFFTEINAFSREDPNISLSAGELYLDVQNISRLWGQDEVLNLRLGRLDIPFGEEYLSRDAIDNPLIYHSIMDLWGVDEGVELYGAWKKLQYVLAIQNGGHDSLRDHTGDKSVTARVGYDPTPWLHLSVSAMRTGSLDVENDRFSELWLGPGFVQSLGSTNTTEFEANVVEGDIHLKFGKTSLKAAGGVLMYDDNDPNGSNNREVYFYSVEGTQNLVKGLYAAARWSQVFADEGFLLMGNGNGADYFSQKLTRDLSLLSLGLGYRWSPQLVLKAEYSFEWGRELSGRQRTKEDFFGVMAAFAF